MVSKAPVQDVRVHLLLGFLGVGKTTAIRHLLAHKPPDERWAVLVNEFGEIGVDARLIGDTGVAVKQIPGGCMCCAAGPVTRVAINALLRQERPDRLLIEPSGLGHPKEILQLLQGPDYASVLQVEGVLTLLDPRQVVQRRYQAHELFRDQIEAADRWVLNKADLCPPETLQQAEQWLLERPEAQAHPARQAGIKTVSAGEVALSWLQDRAQRGAAMPASVARAMPPPTLDWRQAPEPPQPGQWIELAHASDGFHSLGWRISAREVWDADALLDCLLGLGVMRSKGVLLTQRGWLWFNVAGDDLSAGLCGPQDEAVVELIDDRALDAGRLRQHLEAARQPLPTP